jgi:hypothetical protein
VDTNDADTVANMEIRLDDVVTLTATDFMLQGGDAISLDGRWAPSLRNYPSRRCRLGIPDREVIFIYTSVIGKFTT